MKTLKEHIVFLLDASTSMRQYGLDTKLKEVYTKQIEALKRQNTVNQEVRVSVYIFNDTVQNLVFDTDVLRSPNINDTYIAQGNTNLIGGLVQAIEDITKIPQLHGNYSYLVYALSDGENNRGHDLLPKLQQQIKSLADNITLCFLAPNVSASHEAKKLGIPAQNIQIWDVSQGGLEDVGDQLLKSTATYLATRSNSGGTVRSVNNLFSLQTDKLDKKVITKELTPLSPTSYYILPVAKKSQIKDFYESWFKRIYRVGSGYYQFMKTEHIQPSKNILIQEKKTGKVYDGSKARSLLGLPDYEVKVNPVDHPDFNIFVQSTSVNRNLIPGTQVIFLV